MSDIYAENHQKDPEPPTFASYADLPAEAQVHLITLEEWIGAQDGRMICTPADGNTFIDDGIICADDAILAFNKLAALLRITLVKVGYARTNLAHTLDDDFAFWSAPSNSKYRNRVWSAYAQLSEGMYIAAPTKS